MDLPSPHYIYLIQLLFKIDQKPLWSTPPLPVHIPYATLVQNRTNTLWRFPSPTTFSKLIRSLSGAHLLLPVHIPYSSLFQNCTKSSLELLFPTTYFFSNSYAKLIRSLSGTHTSAPSTYIFLLFTKLMKLLSEAPSLLQYKFLIQFLSKIDVNALWSLPPNTFSLFSSYSKVKKHLCGAFPPPSTYSFIQCLIKINGNPI